MIRMINEYIAVNEMIIGEEAAILRENPPQCHVVHLKSHMT
jgi:hypothetical protein